MAFQTPLPLTLQIKNINETLVYNEANATYILSKKLCTNHEALIL
jgi:hypothetical protein